MATPLLFQFCTLSYVLAFLANRGVWPYCVKTNTEEALWGSMIDVIGKKEINVHDPAFILVSGLAFSLSG